MARRPRRKCGVCGERRAVDPDTGWCDACEDEEAFGRELDQDERHDGSWLPDEMTR